MIVKVLKSKSSSRSVIDYNEKKVEEGDACVLSYKNLDSGDRLTIEDTILRYESNPAVSERTRSRSFHMTAGPGPGEELTHEEMTEVIDRLMAAIGYKDQPYVIYQHNDIEREHYHIVSTKIDASGKVINDSFVGRTIFNELTRLGREYGFAVGCDANGREKKAVAPDDSLVPSFRPGTKDLMTKLEALYRRALLYPIHSFYQLQAVMYAMNVRVTARKNRSGSYNILLQGLSRSGDPATTVFSMKKSMGVDGWKLLQETQAGADRMPEREKKVILGLKSAYCMERSSCADEYVSMLAQLDVFAGVLRAGRRKEIDRVTLVDLREDTLLDSGWQNELRVTDFLNAERSGRWDSERKASRKLTTGELEEVGALVKKALANREEAEEEMELNLTE